MSLAEYAEKREHSSKWDLSRNNLGYQGFKSLCWLLQNNRTVTTLILNGTGMCRRSMLLLHGLLVQNSTIQGLDLSYNQLGDSIDVLSDMLANNVGIERLCVEDVYITDDTLPLLCSALTTNTHISQLSLRGNSITAVGARAIATMLATNKTLAIIDLRSTRIIDDGTLCVARALATNHTLRELHIGLTGMTHQGVAPIFAALARNNGLVLLNLSHTHISFDSVRGLQTSLDTATLTSLRLTDANMETQTVTRVLDALVNNNRVTSLDISYNRFDVDGCKAIGTFLSKNTALRHLDVEGNEIDDAGMGHISAGLANNGSLHTLLCRANPIHDDGIDHLCKALRANRSLASLSFDGHTLSVAVRVMFVSTLEHVPNIVELRVFHDLLAPSIMTSTRGVLERNRQRIADLNSRFAEFQTMVLCGALTPALCRSTYELILKYVFL